MNDADGKPVPRRRSEYKSEYKKSYRPFSQYEYVGGRFIPASHAPQVTASLASVHGLSKVNVSSAEQKAISLQGEPWYSEVIELRKQANDYKVKYYRFSLSLSGNGRLNCYFFSSAVVGEPKLPSLTLMTFTINSWTCTNRLQEGNLYQLYL